MQTKHLDLRPKNAKCLALFDSYSRKTPNTTFRQDVAGNKASCKIKQANQLAEYVTFRSRRLYLQFKAEETMIRPYSIVYL